ncbi:HAD hydrolase-like protein [Phenylobacterium parvum]|uniref:HAD hydrolase-like protein n=1 Tax=Phenylobacterium parvum TaxID=2201350 RepID=UPI001F54161E|nr:HAD hydrolase-like protein [Phenylobacterium parvum]
MAYRLVIFDFDGTLADSADWFISMANDVARRFRFRQISDDEIAMLRGRSSREVVAYMRVPAWKMPFIARHTRRLVSENTSKIPLFPESPALIRALHEAGVVLALVSSNSEANVRKILGPELAGCISHYACGASMFGKTPKFRKVIRRAGARHGQVLSIGDETRDIEAASRAGIDSGAVTWGYARPEILEAHRPTFLFNTMDDIARAALGRD